MRAVSTALGAFAAIAALTTGAVAAPVVGTPFFLANTHGDAADYSIASSSNGFLLGWSAAGDTWAQRYSTSASITGSPFLLAKGGSSTVPSQFTSTSRVEVVSNGTDFAARWVNYRTLAICCVSPYNWEDFGGAVIRASGAPEISGQFGVSGTPTSLPYGAVASARPDWVVLNSLVTVSTPPTGLQMASVGWVAPDGATTTVWLFENEPLNAAAYLGFGVASVGATALATWLPPSPAGRVFAIAEKTGTVTMLTDGALPTAASYVFMATNGADYLVVWSDSAGSLRALRVSSAGTVLGAPIVVWNGSDAGDAPGIVAVKAAGSTYLILLRQPVGADASALFGARVLADGTLLDSAGFEIPSGVGGALTDVADDLWLLATLDSVNGASIIVGRYIGATTVPMPPNNVEPPPPPDAGAVPDAAVVQDAGSAGSGGLSGTGGTQGSGGSTGGRGPGSGGRSTVVRDPSEDAATPGADATTGQAGSTRAGGCGCDVGRQTPQLPRFVSSSLLFGLAVASVRRRRRERAR